MVTPSYAFKQQGGRNNPYFISELAPAERMPNAQLFFPNGGRPEVFLLVKQKEFRQSTHRIGR
jgi:hypothetical protein